jgi:hypothetical protein
MASISKLSGLRRMDLSSGLAALRAAVELTRSLRDAAKAGDIKPDEFAGRVGEIYDYIADSKDALVDAKDLIYELKDEIRKLKAANEEEQSFHFMHGVYWKEMIVTLQDKEYEAINGAPRHEIRWRGPFCPLCRDDARKAVRLKDIRGFNGSSDRSFGCQIHKTSYRSPNLEILD